MPEFFGPAEYAIVIFSAVMWLIALVGCIVGTFRMGRLQEQHWQMRADMAERRGQ